MSIIINPDENTLLKFEVDVSGSQETPIPRLIIPISETVSLVFKGTMNNGEVEVDVSDLLELTNSKEFKGSLEVVLENEIFYPWEDIIVIKEKPKVKAKTIKNTIKESKVKVSAKTKTKTTKKKIPVMELKKKNLGDMFDEKL